MKAGKGAHGEITSVHLALGDKKRGELVPRGAANIFTLQGYWVKTAPSTAKGR